MTRQTVVAIHLWLLVVLFVSSCAPPIPGASPPSVPAPGSIETVVVQTAAAAQTQTDIASPPTRTPTSTMRVIPTATVSTTPTPTATVLFLFPTETSLPEGFLAEDDIDGTSTSAASGTGVNLGDATGTGTSNGGGEKTPVPKEWACRVISKTPEKDAIIPGGSSFKAVWTVENTGTKTWPKKGVDVVYQSGARLNEGKPYYDIPNGVGTGGTVTISVTMNVPKRRKSYSTRWSLKVGRTEFCSVRFAFTVK